MPSPAAFHACPLLLRAILAASALFALPALAQTGTAFTYQGQLRENGAPKSGLVDLRVDAFETAEGGTAVNSFGPVILDAVPVTDGQFTVSLNLGGSLFNGRRVFLELGVREDAAGGEADAQGFTTLAPRQEVTATPYAQRALSAVAGSISGLSVADGSITGADVETVSPVLGLQRRASAACPLRSAIRAINDDGTVACEYFAAPVAFAPVVADDSAEVGEFVSAVGFSNNATAAYYDRTHRRLKYVQCRTDGICSAPVVIDDPTADVGQFASMALTSGNAPVIAYYDATAADLKLARCSDSSCLGAITIRALDTAGDVGRFASAARNTLDSGNPAVAYYDATSNIYKLARCQDANCTTNQVTALSDFAGGGVGGSAVVLADTRGTSNSMSLLLLRGGNRATLVNCGNALCNFGVTSVELSASAQAPLALLALPFTEDSGQVARNLPLWAAFATSTGLVLLRQCDTRACVPTAGVVNVSFLAASGSRLNLSLRPSEMLPLVVGVSSSSTLTSIPFATRTRLLPGNSIAPSGTAQGAVAAVNTGDGSAVAFYRDTGGRLMFKACARPDCSDQ